MVWLARSPRAYRFIKKEHADAFFQTGLLRLSSFEEFTKHQDEQRLDKDEGTAHIFSICHEPPPGNTLMARMEPPKNAYVMCASLVPSREIMDDFQVDSGIVIHSASEFGEAVGAQIPGFVSGFDGPCSYQSSRVIMYQHTSDEIGAHTVKDPKNLQHLHNVGKRAELFLKLERFKSQNEWRFIWFIEGECKPHIFVTVPEAIRFCMPWEFAELHVAYGKKVAPPV